MKTSAILSGLGLALLCAMARGGETPGTQAYLCTGGAQHMKGAARVSAYLYTDAIEMPGSEQAKLDEAWVAYLDNLHPGWFFAAKGCTLLPNDAAKRQAVVVGTAEPWKARKAEMIHVNWTYAPVQKSADDDVPSVFCQALRSDNKHWYVSPVFAAATAADGTAAMNAWRTYLKGLKDPDGYVVADSYLSGCDGPGPAKAMKHQKATRAEQISDAGGRIVETGWTFTGTAATVAAAPRAGAPTYQCSMAAIGANYMTPAFASAKDPNVVRGDWRAYITNAHPVQGVARTNCLVTTPEVAAHNLSQVGYTRVDWKE